MSIVFFYPQFKKLTGAERLILSLADYSARRLRDGQVILLTHRFAEACRPALGSKVTLVETGWPMQLTGNHYLDAALEYAFGPALALKLPARGPGGVIFFGPPSVPAMWFARRVLFRVRHRKVRTLYFCFEPPRFVYSDTDAIAARLGRMGALLKAAASAYRRLDRRMVGAAHQVLSNSPYGARRILKAYGRHAEVIEHGVDFPTPSPEEVAALRTRYGLGERPVALTVNHLHPRKRIDLFLRAVSVARGRVPDALALVVGGGPERAALESLAAELSMDVGRDAVFTGAVPEGELPAHYALGDVYVHTGLEESFGLSVIEALYAGMPVVSVAEGGPCDTVQQGVSGFLVPPEPAALGNALSDLLLDPPRAIKMGTAGTAFVRAHFQWERGVDTLFQALRGGGTR